MAAPTIVWYINTSSNDTPSWTTIGGSDTIRFTGPDTVADSSFDPVTAPTSGYKVAEELWLDATSDAQCGRYQGGGATASYGSAPSWSLTNTGDYIAIQAQTNPETAAGNLTAWDTASHSTTAKEILNDMNGSAYSWLRAGETANNVSHSASSSGSSLPSGYSTQTDATTTFQLKGSTYSITNSAACSADNETRYIIHCFVPHDASAGTSGHDPVLTYTYYYT